MATMKDFDPDEISARLIERIKSGELKQMVLQNESNQDAVDIGNDTSMKSSVNRMFENRSNKINP